MPPLQTDVMFLGRCLSVNARVACLLYWSGFNETCHKFSSREWELLQRFSRSWGSKVKITETFAGEGIPIDGTEDHLVLIIRWRLACEGMLCSDCPCVHDHIIDVCEHGISIPCSQTSIIWSRTHTNRVWKLRHIYNLRAAGDKCELIRFWGQEVKDQGHEETKWS